MRILSVHCSVITRKVISCTLDKFGHYAIHASCCDDVVPILEKDAIEGILFDFDLFRSVPDPGNNSFFPDVLRNSSFSGIPVIVLINRLDPVMRSQAEKIGASGILEKPFTEQELLFAVNHCFSQARPGRMQTVCSETRSFSV